MGEPASITYDQVIKPLKTLYVESTKGPARAVLKRKIAEFAEDKRYLEATKWEKKDEGGQQQQQQQQLQQLQTASNAELLGWCGIRCRPPSYILLYSYMSRLLYISGYEMMALVTENRLVNVISKRGRVDPKDKAKIMQLLHAFMEDIAQQLKDDNAEQLNALSAEEKKQLYANMKAECKLVMQAYYKKQQQNT